MESALLSEEKTILKLRSLYQKYGYRPYKINRFEEYDFYVQNKNFLSSDDIITFTDKSGRLMALKPDVTLSIVKNIPKSMTGIVNRFCYNEYVYRSSGNESTYHEIMQVGLECIGDVDLYCRTEVLKLAIDSLKEISRNSILLVSHLGIITEVLDSFMISSEIRSKLIKCIQEKNIHDAEEIAHNSGISPEKFNILLHLMQTTGKSEEVFAILTKILPNNQDLAEFKTIMSQFPQNEVQIDFSLLNDMHYYNGLLFKGFVEGVSSEVLSGGEYDLLMEKMGKDAKAIGFALCLDKLSPLLRETPEYDVDTLILYDDSIVLTDVITAIQKQIEQGKSVTAQKAVPKQIQAREIIQLKRGK